MGRGKKGLFLKRNGKKKTAEDPLQEQQKKQGQVVKSLDYGEGKRRVGKRAFFTL